MTDLKIYIVRCLKFNMNKRVSFPKGNQKKFIFKIKKDSKCIWRELSEKLDMNESTLKSYSFELCDIPYKVFKEMIKLAGKIEKEVLNYYGANIRKEELPIGRKSFGERNKVMGEINITFSNKDLKLDNSKINFSKYDLIKGIKLPNKLTPELAEEVGMHFGDGFLSSRRYDYRLKGNPKDEREYYLDYIKPLFKELFNLDLNIKKYERSFGFELYSQAFWEFKTKVLGIKSGKKYGITFPESMKVNNQKILASFIKGLFDTDGCVSFKTRYGYNQYYPVIALALTSKKLIRDVGEILFMLGFNPSVNYNGQYGIITLNGINAFKRYEELIGWSSQKNLNRVEEWKRRYRELYNG